ncbi:MAG: MMPL family transporter [Nanoarchaeota archaeon]|nr:MMPL family transporter [Nanoarchaeota archaeon]
MSVDIKDTFKDKFIDIVKNFRLWILIFFIFISFLAINYTFNNEGVVINGVVPGSLAEKAGVDFNSQGNLRSLERILYLNEFEVKNSQEFYNYLLEFDRDDELFLRTDLNQEGYKISFSNDSGLSISEELGISLREAPSSNIKLGIELEGGSRLILKPVDNITDEEFSLLIDSLQSRLDVYGASGTKVNKLEDAFSNEKFIIVESTSSNKNDIFELIKRQGNFEASIGNVSVFTGDNILRVFTDPQNARLEGCSPGSNGFVCSYAFSVEIDEEGATKFFEKTSTLDEVGGRLSEEVAFSMDGKEITSLSIASSFKYQKIHNPQITVSGNPMPTEQRAIESAKKEMKFLQTILSTQSLPSKLEVVQSYSISSSLGQKLLENSIWVGLAAVLLVSCVVALRYRHIGIFIGILVALVSEVIIVFGVAAFMRLSIDLAAIGGLIAAIGTGVDDQIIITDEQFRDRKKDVSSRKRLKTAMYIIMIAYFTTLAAMIPLYFAGLKILQGFAFMIIIGVTVGVFITRPAFAAYLRILLTTRKQRKEEAEED